MEYEGEAPLHFTLHLDRTLACPVIMAAWNPDKDLLAMVSTDRQFTVHRYNWQKVWSITPDKRITSICWSPDGKSLAAGYEDGKIVMYDVENGAVIRAIKTHEVSIDCLYWVQENIPPRNRAAAIFDDRALRFIDAPPKVPAAPGMGSAFDTAGTGDTEDAEEATLARSVPKYLSILASGDSDGIVCLNAFGIYPIARLDIRNLIGQPQLSAAKLMLTTDLLNMTVVCDGPSDALAISVDTSVLNKKYKQIAEIALQAASAEELIEVVQSSLTTMRKTWFEAAGPYYDMFRGFREYLVEQGFDSNLRGQFLVLLACGTTSASLHKFLTVTLGEQGLKRFAKGIDNARNVLMHFISVYLLPATENLVFRLADVYGVSRYASVWKSIGLDKGLASDATEDAGMLKIQVERLLLVVDHTTRQFALFFAWLRTATRQINGENVQVDTDDIDSYNFLIAFLHAEFEHDPVGPHLDPEGDISGPEFAETRAEEKAALQKIEALAQLKDLDFMNRTLIQQFNRLCTSSRLVFAKPLTCISPTLIFKRQLTLPNIQSRIPPSMSLAFYEIEATGTRRNSLLDYTCFWAFANGFNFIGILRGFGCQDTCEVAALQLEGELTCVDLGLYKEEQLVVLLKDAPNAQASIMLLPLSGISFVPLESTLEELDLVEFCTNNDALGTLSLADGKARRICQVEVAPPLAVGASRGLASVFLSQRRALIYDLEEDEKDS